MNSGSLRGLGTCQSLYRHPKYPHAYRAGFRVLSAVFVLFIILGVNARVLAQQFTVTFAGGNTNLTTPLNTPVSTQITITDANPVGVFFIAISDNPTLVNPDNVVVSAGGATRTLTVTPVSGAMGTVALTLIATNTNGATLNIPFTVVIGGAAPGSPPVIGNIGQLSTTQDSPVTTQFTVNDANVNSVTFSGSSNDQTFVPNQNITFGGVGTNRTLTVTPINGRTGSLTITITARNANGLTNSKDVPLIVNAGDPAVPIINPPGDQSTAPGAPITVPFTVSDANLPTLQVFAATSNQPLIQSLSLGGSGANRTVTVTPVPGQIGLATIILSALNQVNRAARVTFNLIVISPNSPPMVSGIPVLRTAVNTPIGANFTVLDASPNSLRFSVTSSNPSLIPAGNVVISGSGTQRRISIVPASGQIGNATLTLTVTNQNNLMTVVPVAVVVFGPPVINPIANISTVQNNAATSQFTIADANPASVQIRAVSSNQTLIPDGGIAVTGTGTNRSITLTPARDQLGSAIITLTATNEEGLTSTQQFTFTVLSASMPPVINPIGNQTTAVNTPITVPFTVSDGNVSMVIVRGVSSNVTLVPDNSIFFNGTGNNRAVSIFPAANQLGQTLITLVATNREGLSSNTSFLLNVVPPPLAPSITPVLELVTLVNTPVSTQLLVNDRNVNTLTFSVVSSNPALIPANNVIISGFGNNRTVLITPAPNQTGSATLTITLRNQDGLTAVTQFVVRVIGPPSISAIPNITIAQNSSATINFFVNDGNVNTLRVIVSSNNQTLLPNSGLIASGAGNNLTLSITPARDQLGTAAVNATVTNADGFSAGAPFLVTVIPPPLITGIADFDTLVTYVNTPVSRSFTVNDDRLAQVSFFTGSGHPILIPAENISVTGTGINRTLTITPAYPRTKDSVGIATVYLTASNTIARITKQITVVVVPRPSEYPIPIGPGKPPCDGCDTVEVTPPTLTFDWLAVQGALFYHLQVTPDPAFFFVPFNATYLPGTSATLTGFDAFQTYFWRIRAQFSDRNGPWSPVFIFKTGKFAKDTSLLTPFPGLGNSRNKDVQSYSSLSGVKLYPNMPNPFNAVTKIMYEIPRSMMIELYLTDALGRRIMDIVPFSQAAEGMFNLEFDARQLPQGFYTLVLQTPDGILRQNLIIQR